MLVNKKTTEILCTNFKNGKCHDFRLFKESKIKFFPNVKVMADTGYQGMQHLHRYTALPRKKSKKCPLGKEDKKENSLLASERVLVENVIGMLKRFKIISDRYRNRRKRFSLRFNLLAGLYNFELGYDF